MITSLESALYYVLAISVRRTHFICTNTPYILLPFKQLTEYIGKRASQQEEGELFPNSKMPKIHACPRINKSSERHLFFALSNHCETMQLALLPEPASRTKDERKSAQYVFPT